MNDKLWSNSPENEWNWAKDAKKETNPSPTKLEITRTLWTTLIQWLFTQTA